MTCGGASGGREIDSAANIWFMLLPSQMKAHSCPDSYNGMIADYYGLVGIGRAWPISFQSGITSNIGLLNCISSTAE